MNFLAAVNLTSQALAHPVESNGVLTIGALVLLVLALGLAFAFEFVNGFHDTANAVATVIYTHSLPPWVAVIWSGCWNLIGVLLSGGGVAFGIMALLPSDMVLHVGSSAGFAMVFALLLSAMIWNLGTWYLGLPASSSHSLIGAIVGVGVANVLLGGGHLADGVNWANLSKTLLSLLVSPVIGFAIAGALLLVSKRVLRSPELYKAPEGSKPPPRGIRALLILTCTGVSFGHGSNDGQKGMGLVLLILIGILPARYALNESTSAQNLQSLQTTAAQVQTVLTAQPHAALAAGSDNLTVLSQYMKSTGTFTDQTFPALIEANGRIISILSHAHSITDLTTEQRSSLRQEIFLTSAALAKLEDQKQIAGSELLDGTKAATGWHWLTTWGRSKASPGYKKQLTALTQYIPPWVQIATALALGFGTMIGWKRIVVTVGEKIGKTHLTYGQGAAAELVAASTILFADRLGLPVSTTHVLSSGVAGTMAANKSGLQMQTLRSLLLAWVLTLPVCMLLGSALFAAGLLVIAHGFHVVPIALAVGVIGWLIWWGTTRAMFRPARACGGAVPRSLQPVNA